MVKGRVISPNKTVKGRVISPNKTVKGKVISHCLEINNEGLN
jgi:hypothetical protein